MSPEDRESMILDGAVEFFATHGFTAQIRDLADQIGISQSLIFWYFGTKDELIERVYQRNFIARWRSEWEEILSDRSRPLRERLCAFYNSYMEVIDCHEWIRISMFSGLAGNNLTRRYIETHVDRILALIARETANQAGDPPRSLLAGNGDLSERAYERAYHLHSSFIYYLTRKHIFGTRTMGDRQALVALIVDNYLDGIGSISD